MVGSGGMGTLYRARDPHLARDVALKLLHASTAGSPPSGEGHARLLREAQVLARLSHPNVVAAYDMGRHDGAVFIAMEFIEGVTLRDWLAKPRARAEVLRVLIAAGRGLAAAHAAGVLHRDVNPANVMVSSDGRVRVIDFGLARTARAPLPVAGDDGPRARADRSAAPAADHLASARGCAGRGRGAPRRVVAGAGTGRHLQRVMALRATCLDRALVGTQALVDALAQVNAAAVNRIAQATPASLTACSDIPALLGVADQLPADPSVRETIDDVAVRLAVNQALIEANRGPESLQQARKVLEQAKTTQHAPTIAAATAQLGRATHQTASTSEQRSAGEQLLNESVSKQTIDLPGGAANDTIDLSQPEVDLHLLDHGSSGSELRSPLGTLRLAASPEYSHWVVWTLARRDFVCLEPWTCPGNALNDGARLLSLDPGESRSLWFEIVA